MLPYKYVLGILFQIIRHLKEFISKNYVFYNNKTTQINNKIC